MPVCVVSVAWKSNNKYFHVRWIVWLFRVFDAWQNPWPKWCSCNKDIICLHFLNNEKLHKEQWWYLSTGPWVWLSTSQATAHTCLFQVESELALALLAKYVKHTQGICMLLWTQRVAVLGPRLTYSLLLGVRSVNSLGCFKSQLKTHLFKIFQCLIYRVLNLALHCFSVYLALLTCFNLCFSLAFYFYLFFYFFIFSLVLSSIMAAEL